MDTTKAELISIIIAEMVESGSEVKHLVKWKVPPLVGGIYRNESGTTQHKSERLVRCGGRLS